MKYSWPAELLGQWQLAAGWTNTAGGFTQAAIVTAHVVTGSLILATSLWFSLRLFRIVPRHLPAEAVRASMLEAVQ
jgi:predicted benzoate:H+ symporter BenE